MRSSQPTRVLKFGGTSVGNVFAFRRALGIIEQTSRHRRTVVVASALSGVTNRLVRAMDHAGSKSIDGVDLIGWMRLRHEQHARAVLPYRGYEVFLRHLDVVLATMASYVEAIGPHGCAPRERDRLLAFGERLAVALLTQALRARGQQACLLDATCLIRTDEGFGNAVVDWETTQRQIRQALMQIPHRAIVVVPGFIGRSETGHTTTLGRGGSDYTAALLAAALQAEVLERWTDTNGLYAEDPRSNPDAQPLTSLSIEAAINLNHARKLGMHPDVLGPLLDQQIPLRVRSTTQQGRGTWILPSNHEVMNRAQAV